MILKLALQDKKLISEKIVELEEIVSFSKGSSILLNEVELELVRGKFQEIIEILPKECSESAQVLIEKIHGLNCPADAFYYEFMYDCLESENYNPTVEQLIKATRIAQLNPDIILTPNKEKHILLNFAVKLGDFDVVKTILELNPKAALAENGHGSSAFPVAVSRNNINIIQLLVETIKGLDPNEYLEICKSYLLKQGYAGTTPSHWGALKGSVEALEMILNLYPEAALIKDDKGFIPLHWALARGNLDKLDKVTGAKKSQLEIESDPNLKILELFKQNHPESLLALTQDGKTITQFIEEIHTKEVVSDGGDSKELGDLESILGILQGNDLQQQGQGEESSSLDSVEGAIGFSSVEEPLLVSAGCLDNGSNADELE